MDQWKHIAPEDRGSMLLLAYIKVSRKEEGDSIVLLFSGVPAPSHTGWTIGGNNLYLSPPQGAFFLPSSSYR